VQIFYGKNSKEMEDLIKLLINSNLKLVEKETGIPYDRMYKWVKGKATPKTNDYTTLLNYFNKLDAESGKTSNSDSSLHGNRNVTNEEEGREMQDVNQFTTGHHGQATRDKKAHGGAIPKSNQDEAPYLENVNASAGLNFLTNNGDATSYIKIPGAGVDAYINVFGDSMYPKYCAGEIIGVKQVQKDDLFFGHAFVIQMSDGEAYIKYIQPGKDEEHWSLESENPKYPPRQFHLSKINKIFKIKTTVTKNSL
jgi:phage repressor protein C with HTH and peptisase S24 domain